MAGNNKLLEFLANRPLIICLLYLGGYFTVVTCLVGVVLAYIFRSARADDWTASHFTYAIRTFWMVAGSALLAICGVLLIGEETFWWGVALMVPFAIAVVVGGVRTVLAMINAATGTPMPNPKALII